MSKNYKIDYDINEDLIYFYNEKNKSFESINFGDFVVDLDKTGKIVSLEIFNASSCFDVLTSGKITKKILSSTNSVEIDFIKSFENLIIKIVFSIKDELVLASIAIQSANERIVV